MQAHLSTAVRGTPQVRLASLLMNLMGDDDHTMGDTILTPGQKALYDLCKQDLMRSCSEYERDWSMAKGQQFLADLKRLENVLHKHLSVQGEHTSLPANAYVIAQALTSILTNPKNMCFGNSAFRCWSWSGAHAEDQSMAWGRTHTAVRQFLSDSHPASLQGLAQMNQVCQQFQEGSQADVGDFVGHLWHFARGTFFGGKFFHVHQNGRKEEREQVPLNMIFPPGHGILTLDEIVNQWADEDGGQFLYGAPGALRSVQVEGRWTKHDRELEIPTNINIPFTEDGSHVHMANFKVVSMILHLGQGHENGHYVAIHALDNAYWWADDDRYPTPIEHLTEQHRREVVQIWLVHDHSGELIPDTVEALEPSAPKKAKHHSEELSLIFGNVTFFGSRVQDWIWTKGEHILLLQETHLGTKKMEAAQQYFNSRGWRSHGIPAHDTGRGGNTGGFLVLHGNRHLTHLDHSFIKEGNGWMSVGLQRQGVMIFLIQLYLRTGETLQSPLNAEIWAQLLQYLSHLNAPFIVGGDWQNEPEALAATVIQSKFKAQILDTQCSTTLHGAQLDYLLVSRQLASSLTLTADWDVPWKPHCALAITFQCDHIAVPVQQLQRFPPIGKTFQLPAMWTSFWEDEGPFHIMGQAITGLGSDLARWATQTEKYLTQLLHNPMKGRGSKICLYNAPLVDHTRSQVWKKGHVAFWEKMKVRVNVVHHSQSSKVAQDLLNMMDTLHMHASEGMSQDLFKALVRHWIDNPENEPLKIRRIIAEEEQLAHKAILSTTSEEYRVWLEKAHQKGLRGLFRTLRQRDVPWQRPFQHLPAEQRHQAREKQWGNIWTPRTGPRPLRQCDQAQLLPPIQSYQLQQLMRRLPNKASGPDGISYDFLRHLPYPAVEKLAGLLTAMEREGELAIQLRATNIVLIPKNIKVERPIALTSCLYRLWCSCRKADLQRWQMTLDEQLPWDQARPGRDCLSIAIGRMLHAEISKHQGVHTVTCLADLTCFYDHVDLDQIIEPARELAYPPLHLKFALDLYRGPRTLQAEGINGDPKHYDKGILQGCPQAPAISKLILFKPLKALVQDHPAVSLQTWVDDVSFDIHSRDADFAAREALGAFRTLQRQVEEAGLKLNTDKTGFLTSSKESARALKALLQEGDPDHYDVLRDLGVDSTAGRKRRVQQVKKRFLKGKGRVGILHRLRLTKGIRYRLHKGAVHPVMSWGAQANGLAPQRRQQLRVLAGRGLKLQRSGSADVVFDMHPNQPDPGDSIILQHLHTVWKVLHSFSESKQHLFWTSWNTALGALQKVRYRWQVVSGPLQALQAYMLDLDFDISDGRQWKRSGYGGIPDCCLSLEDPWPVLNQQILQEFRWQRLLRLTRYEGCNDIERPLDWMISHHIQRTTSEQLATGLRAFHQGTLHGVCALCGVELTFLHMLWHCSFWKGRVKDLSAEWKSRLEAGTDPELWQRGFVQSIFYEPEEGHATLEGTGLWKDLGHLKLDKSHICSIAVSPTCGDRRHKRFAFAICAHLTSSRKQVASITGICPAPATKKRALFYALKHLALHVIERTPVALYDAGVWESWKPHAAFEAYPDLFTGLEYEDFDHVWPLLFSVKELAQNEMRRVTQADTQKLANKTGKLFEPKEILDLQSHVDDDAHEILLSAGERMSILLKEKSHFMHRKEETIKDKIPLIQQKKELLCDLLSKPSTAGHQWQAFRSGIQCGLCKLRYHSKSLVAELKEANEKPCQSAPPKAEPKMTRMEMIHALVSGQQGPKKGIHHLQLDRAYLRCTECRSYILARTNEDSFNRFIGEPCHCGPLEPSLNTAHVTHTLARQGMAVECTRCHCRSKIFEDQLVMTTKLRQRCNSTTSRDLRQMFAAS